MHDKEIALELTKEFFEQNDKNMIEAEFKDKSYLDMWKHVYSEFENVTRDSKRQLR